MKKKGMPFSVLLQKSLFFHQANKGHRKRASVRWRPQVQTQKKKKAPTKTKNKKLQKNNNNNKKPATGGSLFSFHLFCPASARIKMPASDTKCFFITTALKTFFNKQKSLLQARNFFSVLPPCGAIFSSISFS